MKQLVPKQMKMRIRKNWKRIAAVSGLILAAAVLSAVWKLSESGETEESAVSTGKVTRQDIVSTLSASGTLEPKDTYSITSMAEGEVVEASFEEGDQVTEGQVLYRIDASSMESRLQSASNDVERAQDSYDTAVSDYNEAATQERKAALELLKKERGFKGIYDEFAADHVVTFGEDFWDGVDFSGDGCTTTSFFELYREYFPE